MKLSRWILCVAVFGFFGIASASTDAKYQSATELGEQTLKNRQVSHSAEKLNLTSVMAQSKNHPPYPYFSRLYCAYFSDQNTHGYSLYRSSDHQDLGNAVWTSDSYECDQAANHANYAQNGLVCGRFYNSSNQTTAYSLYRIYDNLDLGNATIANFSECQQAVMTLRNGLFCSTYVQEGRLWWSLYDYSSGQDVGTSLFSSLSQCDYSH